MLPTFSLAYLTAAPLLPPDAISLAADLGYQQVGLRAFPAAPGGDFNELIEDPALLRATISRLRETGVTVFDMEIVRLNADFAAERYKPFLEVCAAVGAKAILVAGDDPDEARLTASFAAFCEAAHPFGLTADLEFMPWTKVPDASAAVRILDAAGQPNGGILVDTLHVARSTTTLDDLKAIPRSYLHYAQVCDAPAEIPSTDEGLIYTARCGRLLPGDGGIDLASILKVLPADLPISVEIPNEIEKPRYGNEAWAREALKRSRDLVARVQAER
jgi:sugar phosphate isomerase/epimerase